MVLFWAPLCWRLTRLTRSLPSLGVITRLCTWTSSHSSDFITGAWPCVTTYSGNRMLSCHYWHAILLLFVLLPVRKRVSGCAVIWVSSRRTAASPEWVFQSIPPSSAAVLSTRVRPMLSLLRPISSIPYWLPNAPHQVSPGPTRSLQLQLG